MQQRIESAFMRMPAWLRYPLGVATLLSVVAVFVAVFVAICAGVILTFAYAFAATGWSAVLMWGLITVATACIGGLILSVNKRGK